jgi:hypothetical protein
MLHSTLLLPKYQSPLVKYILVVIVLLSVMTTWHNSSHVIKAEQHCQLCLSEADLEHSIPSKTALFEPEQNTYFFISPIKVSFSGIFVTAVDIRGPPFLSITKH